jgi:hypothetical protein
MFNRERMSSASGFLHRCRTLKAGETLPRLPSLIEQVMACHHAPREQAGAMQDPLELPQQSSDEPI